MLHVYLQKPERPGGFMCVLRGCHATFSLPHCIWWYGALRCPTRDSNSVFFCYVRFLEFCGSILTTWLVFQGALYNVRVLKSHLTLTHIGVTNTKFKTFHGTQSSLCSHQSGCGAILLTDTYAAVLLKSFRFSSKVPAGCTSGCTHWNVWGNNSGCCRNYWVHALISQERFSTAKYQVSA